ncbi:hypothetical protein GCM10023149_50500 [Mucilaginibacter gynuensis]|uniref:DUF4314 domain-containing protein n=1 Tax=Mucilaginibacter gynuensis TaxID=1302236 RepID=A0ABP8HI20_9SPHI
MNEHLKMEGRTVMVHPELYDDPAEKTGMTGTIRSVDISGNDFFVDFPDGKLGRYGADALLVLKKPEDIHQVLENDKGTLTLAERKDLFNITLFQNYGFPEQVKTALEMARNRPVVRELGLRSLEDSLGMNQSRARGR